MSAAVRHHLLLAGLVLLVGCGGDRPGKGGDGTAPAAPAPAPDASGLTEFQLKNGIGPVTEEVVLGKPDHELAEKGEKLFTQKCSACHKMGERYVGPPLGGIVGAARSHLRDEHGAQSRGDVHPASRREEAPR